MAKSEIKETEIQKIDENLEKEYHISWYIVVFKMILGIGETLSGLGIVIVGRRGLEIYRYFSDELSEEPHGLLASWTMRALPYIFSHRTFLAIYLIVLGAAKIAGAIGLIYKQNWGVDLLVGLTIIMLPFQVIQLLRRPSWLDFGYIFVGLLIALYLINFSPRVWAKRIVKSAKRTKQ